MSLDATIREYARRAVHGLGQPVSVTRTGTVAYDTATGTTSSTDQTQTVVGRLDDYTDREFRGTVKVGDRRVILAAVDLTWSPAPKDTVTIAGQAYDVVTVVQEMAALLPASYTLQLRA